MIKGLEATINGEELKGLLLKQAEFHAKRAEFYAEEYKRYCGLNIDAPKHPDNFKNYSGYTDPKEQLATKYKEHFNLNEKLLFIAAHLQYEEPYQLRSNDLYEIGIGVRTPKLELPQERTNS